jgi:hypothetical protein
LPFDGTHFSQPTAASVIDKMMDLLGPNGERWIQGSRRAGNKFCLEGAIFEASFKLSTESYPTVKLIIQSINYFHGFRGRAPISSFNDHQNRRFSDVRAMLAFARHEAMHPGYFVSSVR